MFPPHTPHPNQTLRRAFNRLSDCHASTYSYIWSDPHGSFASIMVTSEKALGFLFGSLFIDLGVGALFLRV